MAASAVVVREPGRDWYKIQFWQPNNDFEMSWLLTGREVAFVTQVNVPVGGSGDSWSLADVALDVAFLLRTATMCGRPLTSMGRRRWHLN